jgi:hypothetical protein
MSIGELTDIVKNVTGITSARPLSIIVICVVVLGAVIYMVVKYIFTKRLIESIVKQQQVTVGTLNIYKIYFNVAVTTGTSVVSATIADSYKEGIRIYNRLCGLYHKIQDSREVIRYKSNNDKRQVIIDELTKEINAVKKEINDTGEALLKKEINDNSKFLEKLIDYVLDIPAYLMDDLSVIISRNARGIQNEYDREKLLEALLKVAEWIRKNMGGDSTHNNVD